MDGLRLWRDEQVNEAPALAAGAPMRTAHATARRRVARRTVLPLVTASALCLCWAFLLPAVASAAATASIVGTVTSASTGAPIEGARVWAYSETVGDTPTSTTDREGEYTISGLGEGGPYEVYFDDTDYVGKVVPSVYVTAGETKTVSVSLEPDGSISGNVTVTEGSEPMAKARIRVCAYREGSPECNYPGFTEILTGEDGSEKYTLSELPPGGYVVEFFLDEGPGGAFPNNFTWLQFYNDRATRAEANTVTVSAGGTATGVNASFPFGMISGEVTSGGFELGGAEVCAFTRSEKGAGCVSTNSFGRYKLPWLLSGEYVVRFSDNACRIEEPALLYPTNECTAFVQFYNDKSGFAEADPVTVTDGVTTGCINASNLIGPGYKANGQSSTAAPSSSVCAVPPPSAPASATPSTPAAGPAHAAASAAVTRRRAGIKLTCAGKGACKGRVKLVASITQRRFVRRHGTRRLRKRRSRVVVGHAAFSVAAGRSVTIEVHLTRRGLALLRRAGRRGLKVKLRGDGIKTRTLVLEAATGHGKSRRHGHRKHAR